MRPIKNLLNLETLSARVLRATVNGIETTDERVVPGRRLRYEVQCKSCGQIHKRPKVDALKSFPCDLCFQTLRLTGEASLTELNHVYCISIGSQLWCGPLSKLLSAIPAEALSQALVHGYEVRQVVENLAVLTNEDLAPSFRASLMRHSLGHKQGLAEPVTNFRPELDPANLTLALHTLEQSQLQEIKSPTPEDDDFDVEKIINFSEKVDMSFFKTKD